jgi:hypothetical protein
MEIHCCVVHKNSVQTLIPKGESAILSLLAFRHTQAKCSSAQQSYYTGDCCFNEARRDCYNGIITKTGIDL